MERNQSNSDRVIRIAAGLVMLSMAFVGPQTVWGLLGLVPLLTGMSGFDPIYRFLGISTYREPARVRGA